MSILVATPCYGNTVHSAYLRSALNLARAFDMTGLDHDFLIPEKNDSLVQRARNTIASKFLLECDFQKLLFIDADIEFSPEDVAKLWNMDADVCVGVYRMKKPESEYAAWVDGRLVTDLSSLPNPVSVDYAGTGFMMIDRNVLERMKTEEIAHEEGNLDECWAFFNPRVYEGVYLSEDYAFCHDFRSIGGEILMDTSIRLTHWGDCAYGELLEA